MIESGERLINEVLSLFSSALSIEGKGKNASFPLSGLRGRGENTLSSWSRDISHLCPDHRIVSTRHNCGLDEAALGGVAALGVTVLPPSSVSPNLRRKGYFHWQISDEQDLSERVKSMLKCAQLFMPVESIMAD